MKALSIKQPWADLIACEEKKIEIRTWKTDYRGDFVVCSSAKPDTFMKVFPKTKHPQQGTWLEDLEDGELTGFFQLGKSICIAELYNIEEFKQEHEEKALIPYFKGAYAWHLRNIREIEPLDVKGKLGLYNIEI